MARAASIPVELTVHPRQAFAALGDSVFNVQQIVALSNTGDTATVVHTRSQDFEIDLPLAAAVRILTGGDP